RAALKTRKGSMTCRDSIWAFPRQIIMETACVLMTDLSLTFPCTDRPPIFVIRAFHPQSTRLPLYPIDMAGQIAHIGSAAIMRTSRFREISTSITRGPSASRHGCTPTSPQLTPRGFRRWVQGGGHNGGLVSDQIQLRSGVLR